MSIQIWTALSARSTKQPRIDAAARRTRPSHKEVLVLNFGVAYATGRISLSECSLLVRARQISRVVRLARLPSLAPNARA